MKIHPKCNYKTEESMNYCPRCLKYDKRDFSIRFLYEKYNTESNIARYLIPRRDLIVFFVKFFRCFSSLFLLALPSLSKESNILYADEHRISPYLSLLLNILTFGIYWSFIQERRVEIFHLQKM